MDRLSRMVFSSASSLFHFLCFLPHISQIFSKSKQFLQSQWIPHLGRVRTVVTFLIGWINLAKGQGGCLTGPDHPAGRAVPVDALDGHFAEVALLTGVQGGGNPASLDHSPGHR